MTQFQQGASLRKVESPVPAFTPQFLMITAALVALLIAAAVTTSLLAGRTSGGAAIQGATDAHTIDGYMPAVNAMAATANLQRLAAANEIRDGWDAAYGQPLEREADAAIDRYLLEADQAARAGSNLRFAPQPADASGNESDQRFSHPE